MTNTKVNIGIFRGKLDTAVQRFCDKAVEDNAGNPEENPLDRYLADWLDDFQAWLDMEELHLPHPLTTPAEIKDEEKVCTCSYENFRGPGPLVLVTNPKCEIHGIHNPYKNKA